MEGLILTDVSLPFLYAVDVLLPTYDGEEFWRDAYHHLRRNNSF